MKPPRNSSALPPVVTLPRAAPQCISGRTSYLHFRLAFHPYPHLIRAVCNPHRFGPPRPVTGASPWTWVAQVVSGLPHATRRPLQTRFRSGSSYDCLSLPRRVTRRIILQKARRQAVPEGTSALRLHVSTRFQVLLHSPRRGSFHRSLTVLFAIGHCAYLALGSGLPSFRPDCSCPALLRCQSQSLTPREPGSHGLWRRLPSALRGTLSRPGGERQSTLSGPATPHAQRLPA